MRWSLEVIALPVADVDRAKDFYAEQVGFAVDHDTGDGSRSIDVSAGNRIVQLTPPGSGCSIVFGDNIVTGSGPVKGLQLVVADVEAARAQLAARGVAVSDVRTLGQNPTPQNHPLDNVGFCFFADPDGNGWAVQQISTR